ncbi:MAG: hypothetical protein JWR77_1877 [Rhizorhabdus sp.]|nr:hypothetical protein [Rhizorhabdus sp.]
MTLRRAGMLALGLAAVGAIGWTAVSQTQQATPAPDAALSPDIQQGNGADAAPAATAIKHVATPPAPPPVTSATPMAERIAVIGVLNKRNGIARDLTLHPGQGARLGDLIVRVRACETTADYEPEQLTGAFIQADRRGPDGAWRRIFSGWLYKETPSLNVVEDPLYDVWPKSCTMRQPDIGPDTVAASSAPAVPRSSAKKSAGPAATSPTAIEPSPSALSNSAT